MTAQNSCYRSINMCVCVCYSNLRMWSLLHCLWGGLFLSLLLFPIRKQWFLNCLEQLNSDQLVFFSLSQVDIFSGVAIFLCYLSCVHTISMYRAKITRTAEPAPTTTKEMNSFWSMLNWVTNASIIHVTDWKGLSRLVKGEGIECTKTMNAIRDRAFDVNR